MNAKSVPPPKPEDRAAASRGRIRHRRDTGTSRQPRADGQNANWSASDLVRLLQLRNQLQGERPRKIYAFWVDDPLDIGNQNIGNNRNDDNQPEPDTRVETRNHRNKETRK